MRGIRRCLQREDGGAALEFALLAPMLGIVCLGVIDGWSLASSVLYMRASVNTAASLYMQGAADEAAIHSAALQNWQHRPSDGELTLSRIYKCDGNVVSSTSVCDGAKAPSQFVEINASGSWVAPFEVNFLPTTQILRHEQVIRVR